MNPTTELVRARAAIGASVAVVAHLCEGAFAVLQDGDITRHDELVRAGLRALEPQVDLVILAQASMARVLLSDGVPSQVPILASPGLAVEHLAHLVADRHQPGDDGFHIPPHNARDIGPGTDTSCAAVTSGGHDGAAAPRRVEG